MELTTIGLCGIIADEDGSLNKGTLVSFHIFGLKLWKPVLSPEGHSLINAPGVMRKNRRNTRSVNSYLSNTLHVVHICVPNTMRMVTGNFFFYVLVCLHEFYVLRRAPRWLTKSIVDKPYETVLFGSKYDSLFWNMPQNERQMKLKAKLCVNT